MVEERQSTTLAVQGGAGEVETFRLEIFVRRRLYPCLGERCAAKQLVPGGLLYRTAICSSLLRTASSKSDCTVLCYAHCSRTTYSQGAVLTFKANLCLISYAIDTKHTINCYAALHTTAGPRLHDKVR